MRGRRRTVAHVSCTQSADRLRVKSRHRVVAGRRRPTTVRCTGPRQISRSPEPADDGHAEVRSSLPWPSGHGMALRVASGRIVGDRARRDRRAGAAVVARVPHVPERIDRRGERSGQLGRGLHAECAPVVRASLADRPPARTMTRTQLLPPWSSREGRGWRGVGVHRSCRVGLDWPVLPRPSPDLFLGAYRRFRCPAVR